MSTAGQEGAEGGFCDLEEGEQCSELWDFNLGVFWGEICVLEVAFLLFYYGSCLFDMFAQASKRLFFFTPYYIHTPALLCARLVWRFVMFCGDR